MQRYLLLLALLLAVPAHAGDRDVAEFLYEKARKALRTKRYEEAVAGFERARKEYQPYPEAAFALGEALEKLGRPQDAAAAYQACRREAEALVAGNSRMKSLANRAARAVSRLRKRFAELDRLNQSFIKRCLAFARKHLKSDPAWARRALEDVLKVDPAHGDARRMLAKVPQKAKPKPQPKPKPGKTWGTSLIRGDDLEGWSPGTAAEWSCRNGVVTGDTSGRSGQINWVDDVELKGRYRLRVRFRILRDDGERRTVGIFIGNGKTKWWCLLAEDNDSFVLVRFDSGTNVEKKDAFLRDFNASGWHELRVDVDRGEAIVSMDGRELFTHTEDDRDAFDGKVALFVQSAKVEFKDLEVRR